MDEPVRFRRLWFLFSSHFTFGFSFFFLICVPSSLIETKDRKLPRPWWVSVFLCVCSSTVFQRFFAGCPIIENSNNNNNNNSNNNIKKITPEKEPNWKNKTDGHPSARGEAQKEQKKQPVHKEIETERKKTDTRVFNEREREREKHNETKKAR